MGRALGYIGGILAALAVSVFAAGLLAVYYPDRAWKVLRPLVISRDIQTSWSAARFTTVRSNWKKWRLDWAINGLKVERASPKIQMQMDVRFNANITLFSPRTEVHIELLEITGTSPGIIDLAENKGARNPFEQAEDLRWHLGWMNRVVTLDKFKLLMNDMTVTKPGLTPLKVKLAGVKPGTKDFQALEFNGDVSGGDWSANFLGSSKMSAFPAGQSFLNVDVTGKGPHWNADGKFDMALPKHQLVSNFKFSGSAGEGKAKTAGTAEGQLNTVVNQIQVIGKSDLSHLPGELSSIKGATWKVELPLWPGIVLSHLAGKANITAPIELAFFRPETLLILEKNCKCKWPTVLTASMDGDIWASHLFDSVSEERPLAKLNFKFEPVKNSLLELNLNGELRITRTKEQKMKLAPSVDASVKLPNFQVLKGLLEANRVKVPEPFDILQGSIEATIKTNLWQSDKGLVVPIDALAKLSSDDQKVDLTGKINLYIPESLKSMDIMLDLTVNEFTVEMPPLDPLNGFPQLTKDGSRLQLSPDEPVRPDAFKFHLMYGIRGSKPGAVRLMSKFVRPSLPISFDLDRTARGDTLGSIKTEPFELNYAHRTMHIDQLRAILDERESADFAADGLVRVEGNQYKVSVAISGSLRSPLLKMSSVPELSRTDIISVVLFDRPNDQLVPVDRETVSNFESAISDRAVGLMGLWVFTSAPIRSFSYDRATKDYSATVRLAEGETAAISSKWEDAAQLEIRKRLTRAWVLTASWAPSESKEQMGKVVLQWEKRQ